MQQYIVFLLCLKSLLSFYVLSQTAVFLYKALVTKTDIARLDIFVKKKYAVWEHFIFMFKINIFVTLKFKTYPH